MSGANAMNIALHGGCRQVLNQRVLLVSAGHKLASARFAIMILFAAMNVAVLFELGRSIPWTRVLDDHGCC
jgi:hypothetical protein